MKTSALLLALMALLGFGCGNSHSTSTPPKATNTSNATGNPITAPVDYLGAIAQAKKHSESTISLISINQAIQMFSSEEGRLPQSLQELVTEKYLPRLPETPRGMKYAYNPRTGQVQLVPK